MTVNSHIRRNTGRALQANWSKGIAIGLVFLSIHLLLLLVEKTTYTFLSSSGYKNLFSSITAVQKWITNGHYDAIAHLITLLIVGIVSLFLVSPIWFGSIKWAYAVASGENSPIALVFYFYTSAKRYFHSIGIILSVFFRMLGYLIVSLLPACAMYSLAWFYQSSGYYSAYIYWVMLGFTWLLLFTGLIFFIYVCSKYYLVGFLFVEDSSLKIAQMIRLSSCMMKGERFQLIMLLICMVPLLVLCVIFIPIIFVIPYLSVELALFAKYQIEHAKREVLAESL
ncbi:DUF975 family protein [Clostridium facile]|uniref:DUF975 family protein n=1 Tax=Clostridium facile TaxID=2763035 RepID=A0ABR7IQM9_9CLOT|nr:DUF975 family protein [Clostridium facile]MBC5787456.1 DUF975 family protein [Clostridium facile]